MKLAAYLKDINRRLELALALKTNPDYLRLIAKGHRRAGASMAQAIELHTGGTVTKESLRPDLWKVKA
jgi:DNA-binding transcriptional regulator YdaS (Cro superfamily)